MGMIEVSNAIVASPVINDLMVFGGSMQYSKNISGNNIFFISKQF